MSLNRVELTGGVTREIELQSFGWGDLIELSLAVNGNRYDPESRGQVVTTTYVMVTVFGAQATKLLTLGVGKGDEVYVLGMLDQKTITSSKGEKLNKTRVNALFVEPVRVRSKGPAPRPSDGPIAENQEEEPF